jgi:hypothetical protein
MTDILRTVGIVGMIQLLGTLAAISSPAKAAQLQADGGPPYLCAVVEGGNTASGTPVIAYSCSGGPEDQWSWVGGQLQGIGTANGKAMCLDVKGGGTTPGTLVDLWPCNGGSNQQWHTGTGYGLIYSKLKSGSFALCLDSAGGPSVGGGTQLVINYCAAPLTSQNWFVRGMQFLGTGNAPYVCANVQGSKTADGTPVLSYPCDDAPNELWNFEFGLIFGIGNKCLIAASSNPGSLVSLSASCGEYSLWTINSGTITLQLSTSSCLDRSGGPSVGGGTQLVVNPCTGAASQNWNVR